MRRSLIFIALLIAAAIMAACRRSNPEAAALLARADSLLNPPPSTAASQTPPAGGPQGALHLLDSVQHQARTAWPKADRMRYEVLLAEAMNKSYKPFTTDSVLKQVVRYYDRHGSSNEQLKAHYLLGCAYRDMGEAPAAINAWQEAVDCADTLSTDCDYNTLYRVYGQMAEIYMWNNLPEKQLEAQYRMSRFSFIAGDTLLSLRGLLLCNSAYYTLDDTAAIFSNSEDVRRQFLAIGKVHEAAQTYATPIHVAVDHGQYKRARKMMNEYEQSSGLFGADGFIIDATRAQYHSYKGLYYLGIHEIDSAEHQFRHIIPIRSTALSAYRGLIAVYREKRNIDSIQKYSILFEKRAVELLSQSKQIAITQAEGMYDYGRQEKIAKAEEKKAELWKTLVLATFLCLITGITISILYLKKQRLKEKVRQLEYDQLLDSFNAKSRELEEKQYDIKILQQEKSKNYKIRQLLKQKKEQIFKLTLQISDLNHKLQQHPRHSLQEAINESKIIDRFKEICKAQIVDEGTQVKTLPPRKANEDEWDLLVKHTRISQPEFYLFLNKHKTSKLMFKACLLVRYGFKNPEIATLTGAKYQTISNVRKKLAKELFGLDSAQDLNNQLSKI